MFLPKTLWRTRVSTLEFKNCIFLQRSRKKKECSIKNRCNNKNTNNKKSNRSSNKNRNRSSNKTTTTTVTKTATTTEATAKKTTAAIRFGDEGRENAPTLVLLFEKGEREGRGEKPTKKKKRSGAEKDMDRAKPQSIPASPAKIIDTAPKSRSLLLHPLGQHPPLPHLFIHSLPPRFT